MNGTRTDDDYKRWAFIGKNKCGKTTVIDDLIRKSYDPNVHRLLYLCDSDPKALKHIDRLYTYDELRKFQSGMAKFFDFKVKPAKMLEQLIGICREGQQNREKGLPATKWHLHNGVIFCDDCSNWLRGNVPDSVTTFLGNHRHYFDELFFAVHSLKDLPPILRRRMSNITVFKTLDNFRSYKELEQLDYPNAENLYRAWVEVMNSPDPYAYLTIKTGQ